MMRARLFPLVVLVSATVSLPGAAPAQDFPFNQAFMPQRGRIGVQVQPMTDELREHFGAPSDRGLLVSRVEPNRPAAAADIRVGDVIVAADDAPMREPFDLTRAVGRVPAGGTLALKVIREGREKAIAVRPEGEPALWLDPDRWSDLLEKGMSRGTDELKRRLDSLEHRLEELERKLDQKSEPRGGDRT
jgi:membrane-associated protease RseP (regulator of RpoE activity)